MTEETVGKLNVGVLDEGNTFLTFWDSLCALVVRAPGYRSRGPGSIPGATRFSEKQWVRDRVHSAS
jgi:hypothetical protein